ncbi:hypothetical protein RND81_10G070000 [Saponaria officinalis]|uniref:Ribosomal protein L34Ae n=1 Tax=Saponaria officinalis TaxID=3572 RepID=A0AAW1I1B4_SAPOF
MGTQKLLLMKTHFVFVSRKMVFFIRDLLVSFFTYIFKFFGITGRHFFRMQGKFLTRKTSTNSELIHAQDGRIDNNLIEDEEESESLLQFHFPTFEEFVQNNDVHSISDQETHDSSNDISNVLSSHTQVCSENTSYTISEPSEEIGNLSNIFGDASEVTKDNNEFGLELDGVEENFEEVEIENGGKQSQVDDNSINNVQTFRHKTAVVSDDDESLVSDSDSDSILCSSNSSFRSSFVDSSSDGFLSEIDFERAFEIDTLREYGPKELKLTNEFLTEEDIELRNLSKGYGSEDLDDEDEDLVQELKNLDSNLEDNTENLESNDISDTKFGINLESELHEEQEVGHRNMESKSGEVNDTLGTEDRTKIESEQNSEKTSSGEQNSSDSEEQNGLEKEWEHQDLVEQLKMEIKKVRAIGLPTILEESESPKIMDDLKPWKIEEKYQVQGTMDELHKFYKCYRERMRKLDILNYQKMYAIGFLKVKDPLKPFTKNKTSTPALAAIVSVDCWPCKPKSSSEIHQPAMKKFSGELESDLETVYVGQMCLSWEFLCWEYSKALELWECDPHGIRRYNQVAEKFQTFQVIITRFLEDQPFQGPRVQHYVKNRCVVRNLLQVPIIRDDDYVNRKKEKQAVNKKDAITSLQLIEIIEKSIRVLCQFIRSDNDISNVVLVNCRRSSDVELLNPTDANLLAKVRSTLQKVRLFSSIMALYYYMS